MAFLRSVGRDQTSSTEYRNSGTFVLVSAPTPDRTPFRRLEASPVPSRASPGPVPEHDGLGGVVVAVGRLLLLLSPPPVPGTVRVDHRRDVIGRIVVVEAFRLVRRPAVPAAAAAGLVLRRQELLLLLLGSELLLPHRVLVLRPSQHDGGDVRRDDPGETLVVGLLGGLEGRQR